MGDWWHKRGDLCYYSSQKLFSSFIELNNHRDDVMKIWIKTSYHLKTLWIFGGTEFGKNPIIQVNSNKLKTIIFFTIDFKNEKIEAISQVDVSSQLFEELLHQSQKKPEEGLPLLDFTSVSEEFYNILDEYDATLRMVISVIRSRFHIVGIADDLIERDEPFFWSSDNINFGPIFWIKPAYSQLGQVITQNDFQQIQNDLDNNKFPLFMAFRFLNRSWNDDLPELKILDAAIAAELAIKEFLAIKDPSNAKQWIKSKAPPIPQLYGPILESCISKNGKTGQRSPYLKILDCGNQLRNKIVHNPIKLDIPEKFAGFYCTNVESAIYHLITLLYPGDALWKSRFDNSYNFKPEEQSRCEKEFCEFVKKIQK